ncbi:MAG: HNH endonuclease [Boseongicola sp.]|nr:HNH endonuclease [Boseongicola sp.]
MDEEFWKVRRCMLEPVSEIFEAAVLLGAAADFHAAGLVDDARKALRAADVPEILDWCEELWGGRGSLDAYRRSPVHRFRDVPGLPASEVLDDPNIPVGIQREVLDRDGYFCRFCGIPVIWQKAQKAMRDAYPDTVRWGARNVEKHTAFQAMDLDFDHIVPRSRGGRNTPENLVVSCAPCNCGRGNWMLEEVGVMDPRSAPANPRSIPPALSNWDGLTRVL